MTLDELDPPAWGPPPPGATSLMRRAHALRSKALDDFTSEDLRLAVSQRIALAHVLPRAVAVLQANPMAEGDFYPGDLLAAVRRLPPDAWAKRPDLLEAVRGLGVKTLKPGRGRNDRNRNRN